MVRVIDQFSDDRTPLGLTGIDLIDYVDLQFALRAVNGEDSPIGNKILGRRSGDGNGGGNKVAGSQRRRFRFAIDDNGY